MKETQLQISLPGVPKAKQGREVSPQWEWTEASVWTERMLATLERGVRGGQWYSLMDKVWKTDNLQSVFRQVVRNHGGAGVDAWAVPQEARTGVSAKEIAVKETPEQAYERFASWDSEPSDDWVYFCTVHHHCSASAFQSGTDEDSA